MKRILKYSLHSEGIYSVRMPEDGIILSCKLQNGHPCIWVLTENAIVNTTRHFKAFMTGETIPEGVNMEYIETLLLNDDRYVIHLFEIKR